MKKLVALSLLLFIISVFLLSCGTETDENFNADFIGDTSIDFKGFEINIAQTLPAEQIFHYTENHIFGDMIMDRINKIENNYGLVINITGFPDGESLSSRMSSAMAANETVFDMMYTSTSNLASTFCYAGYLLPYGEIGEYVDTNNFEKYGTPNIYELAMYNNEQYIVYPMLWPEKSTTGCISSIFAINEELIKRYNLTDPRDIFENGEWTTVKFEEITPDYTIKDGEQTITAFTSHSEGFARSVLTCNGLKNLVYENGTVKTGLLTEQSRNIIDWAKNYVTLYADSINLTSDWHPGVQLIAGDTVMALTEPLYILTDIAPYLDDFGCVPFPTGPDTTTDNYGAIIVAMEGISVFYNTKSPQACGIAISELFEPFEGYTTEEERIEYLYKNIFFDERDAVLYYNYAKCATYDYWTVGGSAIHNYVAANLSSKSATEILDACSNMLDSVINKYISTNYEYMSEH